MRLRTRRLLLRPVEMRDAQILLEYDSLDAVAIPAGFLGAGTLSDVKKDIRRTRADWRKPGARRLAFSIVRRRDGAWLGVVSLRWPHRGLGELGYGLHPRHWGQGYATEAVKRVVVLAFDRFGAHRVQATCWVRNPRSARVLVKAGFKKEGRLRGYLRRGNDVRDEFMFGLTRTDRRPRA